MIKKLLSLLAVLLLLPFSSSQALNGPVYEVFVASYADSNKDGMGDLIGLAEKIPYIRELCVSALWLMPIHPSPSYHKYDVLDYYAVDKSYGSMEDFLFLSQQLKKADIKLILDLVINHSSNMHPWFLSASKSLNTKPCGKEICPHKELCISHNPYVNYYNFTKGEGQHKVPDAYGWYYLGNFGAHMPDFNLDDANLRNELLNIARFWVENGADGFRLDAVIHFYEQNAEKNKDFLHWFIHSLKEIKPDIYIVGEAWSDDNTVLRLYESGIDSLFDFSLAGSGGHIVKAMRNGDGASLASYLDKRYKAIKAANPASQNAPFLSNHDMGRIAGTLMRKEQQIKQAAAIYLTLPGVPYIYYGEEIALTGSGRDENKRLPMLWNSRGENITLPPKDADQKQRQTKGVEEQEGEPSSVLNFYKQLLNVRSSTPVFTYGELNSIDLGLKGIAAWEISFEKNTLSVYHNLSKQEAVLNVNAGTLLYAGDTGSGAPVLSDGVLIMPSGSSCIIK
ncbi:MAG: alpha-amylase family glycosyl hydrolase [Eubacteriales bacterium]|nr:alpha-amylase family glycosyl hydrolase [Eubacteriales bacterium]